MMINYKLPKYTIKLLGHGTRGITTLTIQKYTTETGAPHQSYFTFTGQEIEILYNFIRNVYDQINIFPMALGKFFFSNLSM